MVNNQAMYANNGWLLFSQVALAVTDARVALRHLPDKDAAISTRRYPVDGEIITAMRDISVFCIKIIIDLGVYNVNVYKT